jgi:lipopolysaccharide biosynthesis protein
MRISLNHISLGLLLGIVVPGLGAQAKPPAKPAAKPAAPAAQSSTTANERAMDSVRTAVRANRKQIVAGGMDLTTEEHQKFWPLYAEYRDSVAKQGDRLTKIIMEYASNYNTLTDDQATKLMNDYAALDQDRINLRAAYVKKFGAFLPPKKLMRYFQIENKLDAIMNYDLAGTIPLPK